jgi:hypothetical protein
MFPLRSLFVHDLFSFRSVSVHGLFRERSRFVPSPFSPSRRWALRPRVGAHWIIHAKVWNGGSPVPKEGR